MVWRRTFPPTLWECHMFLEGFIFKNPDTSVKRRVKETVNSLRRQNNQRNPCPLSYMEWNRKMNHEMKPIKRLVVGTSYRVSGVTFGWSFDTVWELETVRCLSAAQRCYSTLRFIPHFPLLEVGRRWKPQDPSSGGTTPTVHVGKIFRRYSNDEPRTNLRGGLGVTGTLSERTIRVTSWDIYSSTHPGLFGSNSLSLLWKFLVDRMRVTVELKWNFFTVDRETPFDRGEGAAGVETVDFVSVTEYAGTQRTRTK